MRSSTISRVDILVDRIPFFGILVCMNLRTKKRMAKVKLTLTKRSVESLSPSAGPWIAWDDKLTGFGVRVQPSGTKSFLVNYRANGGGRYSPNRRMVVGRFGRMTVEQARRKAQMLLGRVAAGEDPAAKRAEARGLPTLGEAFEEYIAANPNRTERTNTLYRQNLRVNLSDWINRPLSASSRRDEVLLPRVEEQFHYGGRARTHAADLADQAACESCAIRRCHGGLCRGLDGGAVAGTGAAGRGSDRCPCERLSPACCRCCLDPERTPGKSGGRTAFAARFEGRDFGCMVDLPEWFNRQTMLHTRWPSWRSA